MLPPLQVLVISPDAEARAEHQRVVRRIGHVPNGLARPAEVRQRRGRVPASVIVFTPAAWRDGGPALVGELCIARTPPRILVVADSGALGQAPEFYDEGVQALLQAPLSTAELDVAINELMAGPPARIDLDDESAASSGEVGLTGSPAIDQTLVRGQIQELARQLRDGTATITNISPVAVELQALCAEGSRSLGELVDKIEQDANLAVSVLKASNTAAYRGMPTVLDLRAAGRRLGTRRLAELAQMEALRGAFVSKSTGWSRLLAKMWRNTVTTATTARLLVERVGWPNRGEVYTMALLHNLGEVLVVDLHKSLGTKPPRRGLAAGSLRQDMESQHAELGALLMRSWGLPSPVAAIALAHHDASMLEPGTPLARHTWLIAGAHQAVVQAGYSYLDSHALGPSVVAAAGVLGLSAEWFQEAAEQAIRIWTGSEE